MKRKRKNVWRNMLGGLLLCLMAVICMPGIHGEAAEKKPVCAKNQTVYLVHWEKGYTEPTGYSRCIFIKNMTADAKITNIKSSNKNVECSEMGTIIDLNGDKIKPGSKAKITFKVKQNKKTYSLSCNVIFKNAPCAFNSLKIGGKNYAKKTTAQVNVNLKPSYKKAVFSVKMKPGTKLISIDLHRGNKLIKVKNGSKVAVKKGDIIMVSYKYTKKPANVPKGWDWQSMATECVRLFIK